VAERAETNSLCAREDDYAIDGNRYIEAGGSTIQYEYATRESEAGQGGSDQSSDTIRVIEPFHHLHPIFDRLIDDERIVVPMRGIVGCERVALWTDKLNLKRPREGSGFRWHQDSPYWSHACDHVERLPNVLVALDDADENNGCFRVIRGSHSEGYLPGLGDGSRLGPLFTNPAAFDETDQVPAVVPADAARAIRAASCFRIRPTRRASRFRMAYLSLECSAVRSSARIRLRIRLRIRPRIGVPRERPFQAHISLAGPGTLGC
jgi:hypothetical protein